MLKKIDGDVFTDCKKGDFIEASKKFLSNCQREKDCLCREKNLHDISMCMISHLQYFTLLENKNLPEEILENYVSWRSYSNPKRPQKNITKESENKITDDTAFQI